MTGDLKCKKCSIEITPRGAESYSGLCFACAEKEFNERNMKEALACGYNYSWVGEGD